MATAYIGTSGWVYKGWEKEFYPESVPARNHFQFYATKFCSVEINATFYRLPTLNMVKGWRDKAPEGFVFALKGSRYITHTKRLTNLWQLPPSFKKDLQRLENFAKRLPKAYRHAVEFRHESWFSQDVEETLGCYKVAQVSVSSLKFPTNLAVTADFIYLRFHGLEGGAAHDYTAAELEPWADHIRRQAGAGRDGYAYFNNDVNVRAPGNALLLAELAGPAAARPRDRDYSGRLKKNNLKRAA